MKATTTFFDGDTNEYKMYYHSTCVARYNRLTGNVVLNNGGYITKTAVVRMNQFAAMHGLTFYVFRRDGSMWVDFTNAAGETMEIEFWPGNTAEFNVNTEQVFAGWSVEDRIAESGVMPDMIQPCLSWYEVKEAVNGLIDSYRYAGHKVTGSFKAGKWTTSNNRAIIIERYADWIDAGILEE